MDNFDRLNMIRDQQAIVVGEMPLSEQDKVRVNTYSPLLKIMSVFLIIALILSVVYIFLHPINKVKVKFLLFRNCAIEVVATYYGEYASEEILIDGNLIKAGNVYYEIDGDTVYKYEKTAKDTWKRTVVDEEEFAGQDDDFVKILFDRSSYKRVKNRPFAWRLKNSVVDTVDELSSVTLERDGGKIAIVGYSNGVRISLRFTRFGRTKIDPPWEEQGMKLVE